MALTNRQIAPIRANRFAETNQFSPRASDSRESSHDSQFLAPEAQFPKKGSVWDPETIRENQAIRTNLRIDSRESGHLSPKTQHSWCTNGRLPRSIHVTV